MKGRPHGLHKFILSPTLVTWHIWWRSLVGVWRSFCDYTFKSITPTHMAALSLLKVGSVSPSASLAATADPSGGKCWDAGCWQGPERKQMAHMNGVTEESLRKGLLTHEWTQCTPPSSQMVQRWSSLSTKGQEKGVVSRTRRESYGYKRVSWQELWLSV